MKSRHASAREKRRQFCVVPSLVFVALFSAPLFGAEQQRIVEEKPLPEAQTLTDEEKANLQASLDSYFEEGAKKGYDEGDEEGRESGYDTGYEVGYESGYDSGCEMASDYLYSEGY